MQFTAVIKSRKPSGFMICSSGSAHETFRSTYRVLIHFVIIYRKSKCFVLLLSFMKSIMLFSKGLRKGENFCCCSVRNQNFIRSPLGVKRENHK